MRKGPEKEAIERITGTRICTNSRCTKEALDGRSQCEKCLESIRNCYRKHRDRYNREGRENKRANPARIMLYHAKHRSKVDGLPFNIDESDVKIPELCPLLGIRLQIGNEKVEPTSPSLDRMIPSLGYVKGNVWVISNRANTIKNNASLEEIEMLVLNLRKCLKNVL